MREKIVRLVGLGIAGLHLLSPMAVAVQKKLTVADPSSVFWFGGSVGLNRSLAVVGAPQSNTTNDGSGISSGVAFVFNKQEGEWVEVARLVQSDAGSAFIFKRKDGMTSGAGGWVQDVMLRASDQLRFLYFGEDVAIHKRTVVIGSRGEWTEKGAGYVFERQRKTGEWVESAKLTVSDGAGGEWAGADSVDVHKGTIVLGAPFDDDAGGFSGSAYRFRKTKSGWKEAEKILPSDGRPDHRFARALAVHRGKIIAGSRLGDNGDEEGIGAAYVFD